MNKHCIRMSIVALATGAFSLIAVTGPAQALAASGSTVSPTVTASSLDGTSITLSTTVTVAPDDSCWD